MTATEFPRSPTGVIVGVDGSYHAALAAEWAAHEARTRGVPLTLVHALGLQDVSILEPSEFALQAREEGRAVIDAAFARLRERFPDLQMDTLLSDLSAASALHELSGRCALVVTGTRGHGGFPGMSLGSVSRKLAAHAQCPLVVVPGEQLPQRALNEVVVGVEPDRADAPLEFGFAAAARYGACLHAVRAWSPLRFHTDEDGESSENPARAHDSEDADVDELLKPFRSSHPAVDVEISAGRGNTVPILIEAARDTRLLVVGAHRHRGPLAVGAGYVVDGVLAHCPAPVAVVPTTPLREPAGLTALGGESRAEHRGSAAAGIPIG